MTAETPQAFAFRIACEAFNRMMACADPGDGVLQIAEVMRELPRECLPQVFQNRFGWLLNCTASYAVRRLDGRRYLNVSEELLLELQQAFLEIHWVIVWEYRRAAEAETQAILTSMASWPLGAAPSPQEQPPTEQQQQLAEWAPPGPAS